MFPISRVSLRNSTDLEIITIFNAELRGICNYYSLASNFCDLHYFNYLMEYSCLKTLAAKHNTQNKEFSKMKEQWRTVYIEKCTYGSERGLCKPTTVIQKGGIFLIYFCQISEMLNGLFKKLPADARLIFLSDQSWQYKTQNINGFLAKHNIMQSIPTKEFVYITLQWKIFSLDLRL